MNFANLLGCGSDCGITAAVSVTLGTTRTALKRQRVGICAQIECWFERGAVK